MKFIFQKTKPVLIVILLFLIGILFFLSKDRIPNSPLKKEKITKKANLEGFQEDIYPLSIEYLRRQSYPGSEITIEQSLSSGGNYRQYIASYKSDGFKIYALLTVPTGVKPKTGWPVIIFNHGYIPPSQYQTTERYVAYIDALAREGYIVFKPDYRGHGNSQGKPEGAYGSNAYTIDVLNALSSLKKFKDADPQRIGMWGHSMGGYITLRSMVVSKDIKAGVIWAGVVGSYSDLINNWRRRNIPSITPPHWATSWKQRLIEQYGTPEQNPQFWNSISANSYLKDISGPIQLHHAKDDSHVPFIFSKNLSTQLKEVDKAVEFFSYEGDDHNLTNSFNIAMKRSIVFFDQYVKGGDR